MFRTLLAILLLCLSTQASASLPLQASLADLACGADHVLVGRVVGVDMIDDHDKQVRDPDARTGPGLKNTLRLQVEVVEVIESTAAKPRARLDIPLDPMMHYSLGQIREAHAQPSDARLVFLRGAAFEPIIAGRFFRALGERNEAMSLRAACRDHG
jgi:hypothetical protein